MEGNNERLLADVALRTIDFLEAEILKILDDEELELPAIIYVLEVICVSVLRADATDDTKFNQFMQNLRGRNKTMKALQKW